MRRTINRDTNGLIIGLDYPEELRGPAGSNSDAVKRGDTPSFEFLFGAPFGDPVEIDLETPITSFRWGAKRAGDYAGDYIVSNWDPVAEEFAYTKTGGSRFADAATTEDSAVITSATAGFGPADVGLAISGSGIPSGATIASVETASSCTLSAAATATATGVSIAIVGRTPLYAISPSFNTGGLNDALVDGDIGSTAADQTARYALTGLALGAIVKETSTATYWIVIDADKLDEAAGWDQAPQRSYLDLDAELEVTQGTAITSTLTYTLRVLNDVNRGAEGVPTDAEPSYPLPSALPRIVAAPESAEDASMFPDGVFPASGVYEAFSGDGGWRWLFVGGWVRWARQPLVSVPSSRTARVDKSGGDTTGAVGDLGRPFLTVQAAVTAVEALNPTTGSRAKIVIGVGTFAETILFATPSKAQYVLFEGAGKDFTTVAGITTSGANGATPGSNGTSASVLYLTAVPGSITFTAASADGGDGAAGAAGAADSATGDPGAAGTKQSRNGGDSAPVSTESAGGNGGNGGDAASIYISGARVGTVSHLPGAGGAGGNGGNVSATSGDGGAAWGRSGAVTTLTKPVSLVRVGTSDSLADVATGDTIVVSNTGTAADGSWTVTVGTGYFELQGSSETSIADPSLPANWDTGPADGGSSGDSSAVSYGGNGGNAGSSAAVLSLADGAEVLAIVPAASGGLAAAGSPGSELPNVGAGGAAANGGNEGGTGGVTGGGQPGSAGADSGTFTPSATIGDGCSISIATADYSASFAAPHVSVTGTSLRAVIAAGTLAIDNSGICVLDTAGVRTIDIGQPS